MGCLAGPAAERERVPWSNNTLRHTHTAGRKAAVPELVGEALTTTFSSLYPAAKGGLTIMGVLLSVHSTWTHHLLCNHRRLLGGGKRLSTSRVLNSQPGGRRKSFNDCSWAETDVLTGWWLGRERWREARSGWAPQTDEGGGWWWRGRSGGRVLPPVPPVLCPHRGATDVLELHSGFGQASFHFLHWLRRWTSSRTCYIQVHPVPPPRRFTQKPTNQGRWRTSGPTAGGPHGAAGAACSLWCGWGWWSRSTTPRQTSGIIITREAKALKRNNRGAEGEHRWVQAPAANTQSWPRYEFHHFPFEMTASCIRVKWKCIPPSFPGVIGKLSFLRRCADICRSGGGSVKVGDCLILPQFWFILYLRHVEKHTH